ncbi:hypothetical protein C8J30_11936 [Rhodobacter viridis]|uniref:Uncharacterized protein n=1 Tax=Rhodobacter viridis TaxID=1054202 RepID=A0A318TQT8_9RHOB|nr:hypothetical protein [Rhodobacter viridis]PYF07206.1 hypothetical protein C8J30_11936 [Rhodobacter viridis]
MREVTREALAEQMQRPVALISCMSFEDRSLTVAEAIPSFRLSRWLIIVNEDIETDISSIRDRAETIAAKAGVAIEYLKASKQNPLLLADAFVDLAKKAAPDNSFDWIADITTMTHEMLLILVAAADEIITPWRDLNLIYNLASAYSVDELPANKWISRGIHQVRSVVGFPGAWSPGEQTKLVALPGFDSERMRRMVEEIEPDQLIVGIACPVGERHAWSAEKNRGIAQKLLDTRNGTTFDYPALDPFGAVDALINVLQDTTSNVLLAPLNSKISTAAIGVLARLKPEWQICYAPAVIYNLKYATPSDCFLTFTLGTIRAHTVARLAALDNEGRSQ